MFVIKKIGEWSFIQVTWYQFRSEYKFSRVNDKVFNATIYTDRDEAQEICNNMNEGKEICEVVEVMLPEFRLV